MFHILLMISMMLTGAMYGAENSRSAGVEGLIDEFVGVGKQLQLTDHIRFLALLRNRLRLGDPDAIEFAQRFAILVSQQARPGATWAPGSCGSFMELYGNVNNDVPFSELIIEMTSKSFMVADWRMPQHRGAFLSICQTGGRPSREFINTFGRKAIYGIMSRLLHATSCSGECSFTRLYSCQNVGEMALLLHRAKREGGELAGLEVFCHKPESDILVPKGAVQLLSDDDVEEMFMATVFRYYHRNIIYTQYPFNQDGNIRVLSQEQIDELDRRQLQVTDRYFAQQQQ